MPGVTVAALGDLDYVKGLGKKSTESDILLASFKEGDVNVSMVIPSRYPEKLQSLAYAIAGADAGLLVVPEITKEIGETILALDAANVRKGLLVLRNYLQPEQIQPLLEGTALAEWQIMTEDKEADVRQALAAFDVPHREGPVRIPVDHHFDVKGIGCVILGFVKQGEVNKHDKLRLHPTAKVAQVRSIQVHDQDVDVARTGDHVGLALKNVASEDVDRGHVLAPDESVEVVAEKTAFKLDATVNRFFKDGVKTGRVLYLALDMQFVPVRVTAGDVAAGASGVVDAEGVKGFTFASGETGVLYDLDATGNRVIGRARVNP
jgi:selenocysteine-specific translation elongation factor